LRHVKSIGVEVVLQLALGPGVEDRILDGVGLLCKVGSDSSVSCTTRCRGRVVGILGGGDKVFAAGASFLGSLLGGFVGR
jgi:hypothetical protein